MTEKTRKWTIGIILAISIIVSVWIVVWGMTTLSRQDKYRNHALLIQRDNIELMYEGARADLVQSIDSTIRVYAPSTCLNGLEILRQCESFNVDMFFVLAQGHIESHFGTKGMALRTNSVFNVLAYDGRKYDDINPNGKYSHPDLSLQPYLTLLKTRYLVDGKTETDLMANYIDKDGQRYASSTEYENRLTSAYQMYSTSRPLINKYQLYVKYKILAGK